MNRKNLFAPVCVAAILAVAGSIAIAQPAKDSKAPHAPAKPTAPAASQPEMKLPPGWTEADMQACMEAGMPGKMHERMAKDIGVWSGKTTMWMAPDTEPVNSECTYTITSVMDGRYIRSVMQGEMPGMGPFTGEALTGFDNVSQKFVGTWIDNHSSGIMSGTGELSADGKTLTWKHTYNCPITKKPTTMRQIERTTGEKTKSFEMFGADPKSGKEFKMIAIELTKK
jgi:hypothetical protein